MKNSKFKREMIGYGGPEVVLDTWQEIGEIGVDAGLCWIGDPCYVFHKEDPPMDIGDTWSKWPEKDEEDDNSFCSLFYKKEKNGYAQFHYDIGHPGLGVCVSTGYGDGCYPVFAKFNSEGRIAEVKIKFINSEI